MVYPDIRDILNFQVLFYPTSDWTTLLLIICLAENQSELMFHKNNRGPLSFTVTSNGLKIRFMVFRESMLILYVFLSFSLYSISGK